MGEAMYCSGVCGRGTGEPRCTHSMKQRKREARYGWTKNETDSTLYRRLNTRTVNNVAVSRAAQYTCHCVVRCGTLQVRLLYLGKGTRMVVYMKEKRKMYTQFTNVCWILSVMAEQIFTAMLVKKKYPKTITLKFSLWKVEMKTFVIKKKWAKLILHWIEKIFIEFCFI